MNLRGFKKVGEDEHKATLKNKHGHEIVIAKKSLSKSHLNELGKLPLHADGGGFIGSQREITPFTPGVGDYSNAPLPGQRMASNEPIPDATAPSPSAESADDSSEPVQSVQDVEPNPNATGDESTDAAMQGNLTTGPGGIPMAPNPNPENEISTATQEKDNKELLWQGDLANGYVSPKTYSDLFADRGVLGKIGTIFGLMLSGAGSGLAHQPNALLELMNKEIDRDLEAQKQSKSNAQNFLRLKQQEKMNEATIHRYAVENNLTDQQAKQKMAETDLLETKNHILGVIPHHAATIVSKFPEGPRKEGAKAAVAGLQQAANAEINHNNRQMAEKEYYDRINRLKEQSIVLPELGTRAKDLEEHSIPGLGTTKAAVTPADKDRYAKFNNFQNLLEEAQELNRQTGLTGGKLNPKQKARIPQLKNDLVSSYNDVKGLNRFTSNEEKLYEKIIPDIGSGLGYLTGSTKEGLDRLQRSVKQKKDLEFGPNGTLGVVPFDSNNKKSDNGAGFKVGVEYTDANGNKSVKTENGWAPSKKKS